MVGVAHGYGSTSPNLICLRLFDKEVHAILDPGDIALCWVEYGVESAPVGQSVLTDPQESEEAKGSASTYHVCSMGQPRVAAAFALASQW